MRLAPRLLDVFEFALTSSGRHARAALATRGASMRPGLIYDLLDRSRASSREDPFLQDPMSVKLVQVWEIWSNVPSEDILAARIFQGSSSPEALQSGTLPSALIVEAVNTCRSTNSQRTHDRAHIIPTPYTSNFPSQPLLDARSSALLLSGAAYGIVPILPCCSGRLAATCDVSDGILTDRSRRFLM